MPYQTCYLYLYTKYINTAVHNDEKKREIAIGTQFLNKFKDVWSYHQCQVKTKTKRLLLFFAILAFLQFWAEIGNSSCLRDHFYYSFGLNLIASWLPGVCSLCACWPLLLLGYMGSFPDSDSKSRLPELSIYKVF